MALQLETIRATADRVAASHHLDVVELEFTGGAKHRTLRIFVEKDEATRKHLAAVAADATGSATAQGGIDSEPEIAPLPAGVPVELLSFVTHEDCVAFTQDFGTVLDVEDLIPGAEYTLEVSSPGLERKLFKLADYARFAGSLVKLQTFTAVDNNRHFTGRLVSGPAGEHGTDITLDLSAVKQKGKNKKAPAEHLLTLSLANIEKANLVAEL